MMTAWVWNPVDEAWESLPDDLRGTTEDVAKIMARLERRFDEQDQILAFSGW